MTKYQIAVETIKNSVSALDVADAMGWDVRRERCRCPIHNGQDYNCRLYPGDRGYYCFSCGANGDVIQLVQRYRDTSFKDSISWFNDTFRLGLDLDSRMNPEETRRAENAIQARKNAQEIAEWKDRMTFDLFLAADMIVEKIEEQRDENLPTTPDEPWNPLFCKAIETIPEARAFAEECMMRCIREER